MEEEVVVGAVRADIELVQQRQVVLGVPGGVQHAQEDVGLGRAQRVAVRGQQQVQDPLGPPAPGPAELEAPDELADGGHGGLGGGGGDAGAGAESQQLPHHVGVAGSDGQRQWRVRRGAEQVQAGASGGQGAHEVQAPVPGGQVGQGEAVDVLRVQVDGQVQQHPQDPLAAVHHGLQQRRAPPRVRHLQVHRLLGAHLQQRRLQTRRVVRHAGHVQGSLPRAVPARQLAVGAPQQEADALDAAAAAAFHSGVQKGVSRSGVRHAGERRPPAKAGLLHQLLQGHHVPLPGGLEGPPAELHLLGPLGPLGARPQPRAPDEAEDGAPHAGRRAGAAQRWNFSC